MKIIFLTSVLIASSFFVFSQSLKEATISGDFPVKSVVINDIKSSSEVISGLNGLSLGINKGETYTITELIPDKENSPSNCPANVVLYKISIDYPILSDNTHKRVFVSSFYKRNVSANCATDRWTYGGIHKHLSWLDEAHLIDKNGIDLTHQKNVELQKQKDLEEKAKREEKLKGDNPANNDEMINIALEGTKLKPSKFFGTSPVEEISDISVTIPADNKYMGKGTMCTYICNVNYKYKGELVTKKMKIQGKRSSESEPFKFFAAFEQ